MSSLYKSDDTFFSRIIIRVSQLSRPAVLCGSTAGNGQIQLKSEYLIKLIGNIHKENFKNYFRLFLRSVQTFRPVIYRQIQEFKIKELPMVMQLTGSQRKYLRGLAHHLNPGALWEAKA